MEQARGAHLVQIVFESDWTKKQETEWQIMAFRKFGATNR